jgi:ABC-type Fe3+ transport system permease subunit
MTDPGAELPEKPLQDPEYRNIAHRALAFITVVMIFAPALATVITLVFFGFRIFVNGPKTCVLLYQEGMLDRALYTSCGCALVGGVLILISLLALWWSTPRLRKHFQYVYRHRQRRF